MPSFRFLVILLSCALLSTGCFRAAKPDVGLQELRTQVEQRVLDDAERAFLRADYSEAIRLLTRFLHNHPQSSRSLDARWWLARSYQEAGHLSSAAEHFRLLTRTQTENPYQAEARLRVSQIEDVLRGAAKSASIKGIVVSLESMQTPIDLVLASAANRQIHGSLILLDVPCGIEGNGLREDYALSFESLAAVIQHMSSRGMAVYLGVRLRCLGRFAQDQPETLEVWSDWEYVPQSGSLRRSPYFSLSVPDYRAFLVEWLSQFRDLPLMGVVLRHETTVGIYEGLNPLTIQSFQQAFDTDFDPVQLFGKYRPATGSRLPAVFWKWAGWKARERLRILQNMVQTLRGRLPGLQVGIEVQLQSVADPVHGLVHFAEDWVEVAHGPFDVFVTTLEGSRASATHAASRGSPAVGSKGWNVIEQMVQYLGRPEKIWTILPHPSVPTLRQSDMLPEGVGRLYDYRVVP